MGTLVAEEVLLAPAAEHCVGDEGGVGIASRRDDLGLVSALLVEPGDLATGEAAALRVVGKADRAVGQEVVVGAAQLIGETHRSKGRAGLSRQWRLAVGEDVEAGLLQLGKALGAPPAPVEADRRAGVWAEELADLVRHRLQLADEAGPRSCLPDEQPVAEAVRQPGVDLCRHGYAHASDVGLLNLVLSVIRADVAVDVKKADSFGMGLDMAGGERHEKLVTSVLAGELGHAKTQA